MNSKLDAKFSEVKSDLSVLTTLKEQVDKLDENVGTLFELNDARKAESKENTKQVGILRCVTTQQQADLEKQMELTREHSTIIQELRQKIASLEARQQVTEETSVLIQNTQHDDYDKAFKKEEFQRVFLFLITFGYNTLEGRTCVVFYEVNNVLCVCVNLRALSLIAKLKLSYSQVTKDDRFPHFSLFKINSLRQLFRDAKLPQLELDARDVETLCKMLAMRDLKSVAGNKSAWVALEADPFVLAIENLKRAKKVQPFCELFQKHYPKTVKPKKVTEKDSCFFVGCTDQQSVGVKQPLFLTQYWKELFYPSMKQYRKKIVVSEEQVHGHAHFSSLFQVLLEDDILSRDIVLQQAQENKELEEAARPSKRKRNVATEEKKEDTRSQRRRQEEEPEGSGGEEEEDVRTHKRPRQRQRVIHDEDEDDDFVHDNDHRRKRVPEPLSDVEDDEEQDNSTLPAFPQKAPRYVF